MEAEVLEKQERLEEAWKQMEQALAVIRERSGNCKGAHFTRIGYKKRKLRTGIRYAEKGVKR